MTGRHEKVRMTEDAMRIKMYYLTTASQSRDNANAHEDAY